ncbi:MAG: peptide deformylase [Cytophagia bacterium]|nr:peptide deformylase [Cytophagia bacterium]
MIYPILAYGDNILRKEAQDFHKDSQDLTELVENMFETMYSANGVGLAAPQIGLSHRIFVIDSTQMGEEEQQEKGVKRAFINPEILDEYGNEWTFEEGCLSIPDVHADILRPEKLTIHYYDELWNEHEEEFDDLTARVIQHEYDHLDGVLFTDYIKGLKKQMLRSKLVNISKGNVDVKYRMKFPQKK